MKHDTTSQAIGPNALLQPVAVLRRRFGEARAAQLLAASTGRSLDHLPDGMVDEGEVASFHRAIIASLGWDAGLAALREAGLRTGDYLLANRIPKVAQSVLKVLPKRTGLAMLSRAMARHAWTFAGSGRFHYRAGSTPRFEITGCPLCRGLDAPRPACAFYAGTFERLVDVLIAPAARVEETECEATGGLTCRFAVRGLGPV